MPDTLIFASEEKKERNEKSYPDWKIMVVDDEEQVHAMTSIILREITFEGRGIELIKAYSAEEAKTMIRKHPDTAIILLDVVMEHENSGLEFAKYIRHDLKNHMARIILRTGQPGQAPERSVITEYDINDYKEKTELTSQKLYTTVIAALRSYRDIIVIEQNKRGLEKIIESSKNLFRIQSLKKFAAGVLQQLSSFMNMDDAMLSSATGFAAVNNPENFVIIAGVGTFENHIDQNVDEAIPEDLLKKLHKAVESRKTLFFENEYIGFFDTAYGSENILYLKGRSSLSKLDKDLLRVFSANIGVAFDNIYLRQQEKQNEELLKQAQKMETVGTLAGGIAHDFNNLLSAIFGAIGLINFDANKHPNLEVVNIQDYINTIEMSAHRAADMVKQLLTLSRKNKLSFAPVDLVLAIKHVLKICQSSFDKSIDFKYQLPNQPAMIKADPTQIEQTLLNVCVNASHAMTIMREDENMQGGTLEIALSKVHADHCFCSSHPEASKGYYWSLAISDTGIGMDNDTLKKIYNPFFTTKKEGKGTGLGLAMVYNIVKQHKGFIVVRSQKNTGTIFNLFLPILKREGSEQAENNNIKTIITGSGNILLVDDEELILATTKALLQRCGYNVFTAKNGEEAVEEYKSKKNEIDLVMLDMAMPKMSGKQAFEEIRKINAKAKVILASAYSRDERIKHTIDAGANAYIAKPYSVFEISKLIDEVLKK